MNGLFAAQRQIVCSGCFSANLPHALPTLRCARCDKIQAAGSPYRRAHAVGESHSDVCVCVGCFELLFSHDASAREKLLAVLDDEVAKLGEAQFATLTWCPEESREFDNYVQCTHCDGWYHYICGMYPAVEQLPRGWRIEAELFVCAKCTDSAPSTPKSLAHRAKLTVLQVRRRYRHITACITRRSMAVTSTLSGERLPLRRRYMPLLPEGSPLRYRSMPSHPTE